MTDVLTKEQRRLNMSRIRGKDTTPEIMVRSYLHQRGYRYQLHVSSLPGKPDLVFKSRRKAIFVHGCFWHLHACKYGRVVAKTNAAFWAKKRADNAHRDAISISKLRRQGWSVLVIWECWLKRPEWAGAKLIKFLES